MHTFGIEKQGGDLSLSSTGYNRDLLNQPSCDCTLKKNNQQFSAMLSRAEVLKLGRQRTIHSCGCRCASGRTQYTDIKNQNIKKTFPAGVLSIQLHQAEMQNKDFRETLCCISILLRELTVNSSWPPGVVILTWD